MREDLAQEALRQVAGMDPQRACLDLGVPQDCPAVERTLGQLRDAVPREGRPDVLLDLLQRRVHADYPADSPARRAALLTLMMARGAARRHMALPFDTALLT